VFDHRHDMVNFLGARGNGKDVVLERDTLENAIIADIDRRGIHDAAEHCRDVVGPAEQKRYSAPRQCAAQTVRPGST
jgi:hypothetical protein